ncbi:DUF6053 domain-containing protein [Lysobacter enzymogenes]|uniref:DUF6053 domain-containing protein n=1 Tax=Lysobacter enzymogenes TaxID=69 RepID=UPI0033950BDF
MPAQPLVGGPSGPRLLCQIAATGNKSVGPEGPPTRDPNLGAGGPLPKGIRASGQKTFQADPVLRPESFPAMAQAPAPKALLQRLPARSGFEPGPSRPFPASFCYRRFAPKPCKNANLDTPAGLSLQIRDESMS